MEKYNIVRFFFDDVEEKIIKRDLTLEEARKHCNREDTQGPGWFDGYRKV